MPPLFCRFRAAACPLAALSAAVIGAMVPDFGCFFPGACQRLETHSAMALFTFCLPVGLIAYWVFQHLIKSPMMEVLPDGAYARWRPFAGPADFTSARQWLLAACGVLAGAVTHLVWDAFTHEGARGVRMFPCSKTRSSTSAVIGSPELLLLQDVSSLIGLWSCWLCCATDCGVAASRARSRAAPGARRASTVGVGLRAGGSCSVAPPVVPWARVGEQRDTARIKVAQWRRGRRPAGGGLAVS